MEMQLSKEAPVRPSKRRILALTWALDIAHEAVKVTNQDPAAAVQKYGASVAILGQLLLQMRSERVTASSPRRKRRNRGQKEHILGLQHIASLPRLFFAATTYILCRSTTYIQTA
jgi:hypothetical protein